MLISRPLDPCSLVDPWTRALLCCAVLCCAEGLETPTSFQPPTTHYPLPLLHTDPPTTPSLPMADAMEDFDRDDVAQEVELPLAMYRASASAAPFTTDDDDSAATPASATGTVPTTSARDTPRDSQAQRNNNNNRKRQNNSNNNKQQQQNQQAAATPYYPVSGMFIPDQVRNFIGYFHKNLVDRQIVELHNIYEFVFNKLTEKFYQKQRWPEPSIVAPLVDNDPVFLILYKELYYRHVYAWLHPTVEDRLKSWENYCDLFNYILSVLHSPCLSFSFSYSSHSFTFSTLPSLRPPFVLPSHSLHTPFTLRSPSLRPPFTLPSPSLHPPLTLLSPSPNTPFTLPSPSLRTPFTLPSPSVHPAFILPSYSLRPPFTLPSPSLLQSFR